MLTSSPRTTSVHPFFALWTLDWGGLLALGTLLSGLVYGTFVVIGWHGPGDWALITNSVTLATSLVVVVLAARAASSHSLDRRTRLGWLGFAVAFGCNALGNLSWLLFENILQDVRDVSIADGFWLTFYPLVLGAVLFFPTAPRGRSAHTVFWLDVGTVLLGGVMAVWYFSLGPRASLEHSTNTLLLVSLAYPLCDIVVLFAVITIALNRPAPQSALPLRLMGLGLIVYAIGDLGYTYLLTQDAYTTGTWPALCYILAYCIAALAAQLHYVRSMQGLRGVQQPHSAVHDLRVTPYIGIAVGYGLLLVVALQQWVRPLSDLVLLATGLTALVLVRQVVAVRENVRLAAARDAAEQASKLKSEFLANMSHELRTPLNSIINFSRIVGAGMRGPVNDDQRDYLDRVRQSGEHLLGLINDILDLSKIEAGQLQLVPETLTLADLVQSTLATAAGLVKDKPITLHHEVAPDLPLVVADRTRVRQVLLNLLSNAAKFTDTGTITVRVERHRDTLIVRVRDTGIGIPREHLATIFEEFRQVDSAHNRRYEGTGLGLAICRKLVTLHGGELWVESVLGVGSTFSFSLPINQLVSAVATAPPPLVQPTVPAAPPDPRPVVLVVDDDPSAIEIVAAYLARDGYRVAGVTDSRDALAMAQRLQPAAIILDVLMPHKDGWEVLGDLKNDPLLHTVPVVLYTIVEQQQLGFVLGADAYLLKPIAEAQLRHTIAALVTSDACVLVIDDDGDTRELLTHQLGRIGHYQVTTASNGREGLTAIAADPPDVIILDLMMPEVDGFAVLEALAADPVAQAIPVIVLTAKDLTRRERERVRQRVRDVLQKGQTTPEQVLAAVAKQIAGTPLPVAEP